MPLIGDVNVRGQTSNDLARSLEQTYSQRYLNSPDISVRVLSSSRATLTVEGGVKSPGVFALTTNTTLLGAIAMARGIDGETGNPSRVAIFRKRDGATVAAR
jgi:polysaccharide biosynthesis/export protein